METTFIHMHYKLNVPNLIIVIHNFVRYIR